jgi:CheY-like chemotaxis protein
MTGTTLKPEASIGRALLVSDDEATIQQLTESTRQFAISLEVRGELAAALQQLKSQKFEAIIVDFRRRGLAQTILEEIPLTPSNASAITFGISDNKEETAEAFNAGSRFVLERPLSADSINRTMKVAYGLIVRERRRYFRCPLGVPVAVRGKDFPETNGQAVNISEGGMALNLPVSLHPGQQATLTFMLPGIDAGFAPESTVCWHNEGLVGVKFSGLPPLQKSELQHWLGRQLEHTLPESVAGKFRS